MCKRFIIVLGVLLLALSTAAAAQQAHKELFAAYMRHWAALEYAQEISARELRAADHDDNAKFHSGIQGSTRMQSELGGAIVELRQFKLQSPFEELVELTAAAYEKKIALYKEFAEVGTLALARPKADIDYVKYAARLPQITAELDATDKALLELAPVVFSLLLDWTTLDTNGDFHRLIVTRAEREQLMATIDRVFGTNHANQSYALSSALRVGESLADAQLKSSDDP